MSYSIDTNYQQFGNSVKSELIIIIGVLMTWKCKRNMKRIEAFVPTTKRSEVVNAILSAGSGGVTVTETRGRGAGERPLVGGARGTSRYVAEYNRTDTIVTIVDDSKIYPVIEAIINAASTGSKGDGKIFVSPIEESFDIGTKEKKQLTA